MTRLELRNHPLWPLYRKVRRHVARQIEAETGGGIGGEMEIEVDEYLEVHLEDITLTLQRIFRQDLATLQQAAADRTRKVPCCTVHPGGSA